MSDIYGQYLTMKEEIDMAIQEVIKSTYFIKSGKVLDFEAKLSTYLNTNVVACGNGTDALQIAFMALGYKKGDFPHSEQLAKTVFSLPVHTKLRKEQ